MALYAGIVQTLAALALLGTGAAVGLLVAQGSPAGRAWLRERLSDQELHPIAWAWFVALMAMSGSLYFSDVVGFTLCLLCWYQRIAMYPIVFVLGMGLLQRDPTVWRFALPLPLVGLVISLYHVALQYRPSLEIVACGTGTPKVSARTDCAPKPHVSAKRAQQVCVCLMTILLFRDRPGKSGRSFT